VACGVGAIPSFEPATDAERNVYALARKVFGSRNESGEKRLFLEMCYKVRLSELDDSSKRES
jgi:quinate dehydrogenase